MVPREVYQQLISVYQSKFRKISKELLFISFTRLATFILLVLSAIFLPKSGEAVLVPVLVMWLALFLFLVKKYISKEKEKEFYGNLILINGNELKAMDGDFSSFKDGNEFADIHHPYSYDLDLFGPRSFFQFINRTSTQLGKKKLASLLNFCETNPDKIRKKQDAIEELAKKLDWRQHFAAKGKTDADQHDFDLITEWSATSFKLRNERAISFLIIILPVLTLGSIILSVFSFISWNVVLILVLSQWMVYGFSGKMIKHFHRQFGSRSEILAKYTEMLHDIESTDFRSEYLQQIKQDLYFQNMPASRISRDLMKLIGELDYGRNLIVSLILNSVFLWDIRCIYKLSKWHQKYHQVFDKWFGVLADFDALSCFGNFNYNHGDWAVPVLVNGGFTLIAEELGHPLISSKKRIDNNFRLEGAGKLAIITGANMAGKSTFLRTVGINMLLAMNGCKVCARQMQVTPVSLYTNMRTTDNLMNDESYFYAELLRLQQLLEKLRAGEKLFVIIDEMLKGTNSVDKLNGSKELIKQLISLKTVGIVATHDLKLTELEKQFPESIQNQCFEVQLTDDDLSFDYRLRDGVTSTMNATFLMKKMGIIG